MNKSVEQLQRQLELHLNTISADQRVFETVLQVFLLNMIQKSTIGDQLLHAIRHQVLGSIDNTMPGTEDPQGSERHKQLTKMRAEEFFQVLAAAAHIKLEGPEPWDVS